MQWAFSYCSKMQRRNTNDCNDIYEQSCIYKNATYAWRRNATQIDPPFPSAQVNFKPFYITCSMKCMCYSALYSTLPVVWAALASRYIGALLWDFNIECSRQHRWILVGGLHWQWVTLGKWGWISRQCSVNNEIQCFVHIPDPFYMQVGKMFLAFVWSYNCTLYGWLSLFQHRLIWLLT